MLRAMSIYLHISLSINAILGSGRESINLVLKQILFSGELLEFLV